MAERPWDGRIEYKLLGIWTIARMEGTVVPKEGMYWWIKPFVTYRWLTS
jgi:hypothetical protein